MSYGANIPETFCQAGNYVERIPRKDRRSAGPIAELAIDLKAAKVLGLDVPIGLAIAADELIE